MKKITKISLIATTGFIINIISSVNASANSDNLNLISSDQGINEVTVQPNKRATVNFTANFNDGTPAVKFTWNFPANTDVTYAKLFEMAGLNINDFNIQGSGTGSGE